MNGVEDGTIGKAYGYQIAKKTFLVMNLNYTML